MKTHIDLDEELLKQVITLGNFPTKKAAIQAALTEFAKTLKRRELLSLRGQISWHGDLDQLRATRNIEAD
ncbi:type II toxin-antitoxin system VapB family antitoxin [Nitrosomonas communis]|uniref:type II toxin-antitoxin system VapB family antitoxin n=1 Tax=Nitrosomonas communis TaxID=44574 RepID=UPI0026EFDE44|nr:type II toxin-antitoxin system VapB family antitoxin [Nitrosomonas communis]MCO6428411.1 type II toxin-antitoxin system VapB family antitoxin [Nitrosomonas communis]